MTDRPIPQDEDPQADAVGRRIRAAAQSIDAPPRLRGRLAQQREAAAARPARLRLPALVAAGLAAVAVAVVLLVSGGGTQAPSFDQAAKLATAPPTGSAPAGDPSARVVQAAVGGVQFPNYAYRWPSWKAVGARRDHLAGRDAVSVTYRGPAGDVGYTIVDGAPLPEPSGARHISAGGLRLAVVHRGTTTFVTWRRGGHTCVLAGRGPGIERQLVRFATWA